MLPFYFVQTKVGYLFVAGSTLIWVNPPSADPRDYDWIDEIECPAFCCEL